MFDINQYMQQFPKELLLNSAARKHLCRTRPMLFAILYLPHHISFDNKPISFSQFHLDLFDYAEELAELKPGREFKRDVFIAPRNSGKTTFVNLIIPLWLAAYEYESFMMSFSDSEAQAIMNLQTIKTELESNELLRQDFPEFCNPKKSRTTNRFQNQSQVMIHQANDFVMVAKGVDSNSLGSKAGHRRPGLVILDDIEGTEANYSENAAQQRLQTVLNGVLPLNIKAKFIMIGTTTRPNSIIDQTRQVAEQHESFKSQFDNAEHNKPLIDAGQTLDQGGEPYLGDTVHAQRNTQSISETLTDGRGTNDPRQGSEALRNELCMQQSALESQYTDVSQSQYNNDVKSDVEKEGESTTHKYLNENSDVGYANSEQNNTSHTSNNGEARYNNANAGKANANAGTAKQLYNPEAPKALYAEAFEDYLDESLRWVVQHLFKVNYYSAIVLDEYGAEHSLWAELWSIDFLKSIRHTRMYAMNYANKPVNLEAGYWNDEDIVVRPCESFDKIMLAVDPAVTTSKRADFSGFAVIGTSGSDIYVIHSEQIKSGPDGIRSKTNELVDQYGVQLVYLETNFGSELWRSVFDGLQTKIRYYRTHEKKELRITRALDQYKRGKVYHCKTMNALEDQMRAYPKTAHEDILDAVAAGVNYFTAFSNKPTVKTSTYV